MIERFPLARRIEHMVMLLSFSTLALTGLVQKYPLNDISIFLVSLLGGIEVLRIIHRVAAVFMLLGCGYHLLVAGYKMYVRREPLSMLPGIKDALDAWQSLRYNIGLAKSRPQMGRFTFEEKAEYWAFVWGALIMGITGFIMWNPIAATQFMPGEFIVAAKAAHGAEAVLAVLAIILWHFYHVHIKFLNKSMFTGKLSEQEMLHDHPVELADLKSGQGRGETDPAIIKRREKIYFPIAGVLALIMIIGLVYFVTLEATAIETIPPASSLLNLI
jgi:cytochrome b subunit of formate dehydrogenase